MNKIIITLLLFLPLLGFSQNVSINESGTAANSNAILDVNADVNHDKGVLLPRLTTAERTALSLGTADAGLTVFDTDTKSYWWWDGSQWTQVGIDGRYWNLTGNSGTTAGTNFIGTTDAVDLVFKTNNTEYARITAGGKIGIGTTSPSYPLTVINGSDDYVGYFQSTETNSDNSAVYGICANSDYYGYGGYFQGGYIGVRGNVYPSGSNYYYGVVGIVSGGSGHNRGIYGYASNQGSYGVYGSVDETGSHGIYGVNSTTSTTYDYTTSAIYGSSTYDVNGVYNGTLYNATVQGWNSPPNNHDAIGVWGQCWPDDYWGYGGWFEGGYYGVKAVGQSGDYAKSLNDNFYSGGLLSIGQIGINSIGSEIGIASISKGIGLFVKNSNKGVAEYISGISIHKGANITLLNNEEGSENIPVYTVVSDNAKIQIYGQGQFNNGEGHVNFNENFSGIVSDEDPIIVIITPTSVDAVNLVVANTTKNGFDVISQDNTASGTFNWMAIGIIKEFKNINIDNEIINKEYEDNQISKLYPKSKGFTDINSNQFYRTLKTRTKTIDNNSNNLPERPDKKTNFEELKK